MKKKLQVFISSTYTDMLAERQAAVEAVLQAGHIPAGMELFSAEDESQLQIIRRWIDDSDVFVLILGGRYGSIEERTGRSYIHLEYEYATKRGKPLFAAIISDASLEAKIKSDGSRAIETSNGRLLKDFKETVMKKICRRFEDVNELKLIISQSIANIEQDEKLVGWIRGSDVVNPRVILEEMNRLKTENAELKRRIAEWEILAAAFPSRETPRSIALELSEDARNLLFAANAGGGYIMYNQLDDPSIIAGDKNFIESDSNREETRWKAAIDDLQGDRLIESSVSGPGLEQFKMTMLGYRVADEIERGK
jgi:Domain of unknown function (DUF4062)